MVTLLTIALATTLLVLGLLFLSGRFHPGASAPWKQEARVKIRLADLWRCEGMLDRGPYLLMGRFLASYVFHRRWSVFNYLEPAKSGSLRSLSHEEAVFYGVLVITALPFIWVGVALTLRRLRATRLPTGLVLFFFLPVVNLLFFLMLSILPSSQVHEFSPSPRWGRFKRILHRIIPDHAVGSAAVGLLLTLIIALPSLFFGVRILGNYGWGLFVGLPFCLGLSSVLIYSFHLFGWACGCSLIWLGCRRPDLFVHGSAAGLGVGRLWWNHRIFCAASISSSGRGPGNVIGDVPQCAGLYGD